MLLIAARRLLATVPVVLSVSLVVFLILFFTPGDPAAVLAGDHATPEDLERVRAEMGLDRTAPERLLIWLGHIFTGDLGRSIFSNLPVAELLLQRAEPTLSLAATTVLLAIPLALALGVVAAWRAGGITDRLIMLFAVLGFSVPIFVIGYALVYLFAIRLHWVPVQGFTSLREGLGPFLNQIILPAGTLGIAYVALLSRISRSCMMEVLNEDYVRTARAKGAGELRVLIRHALRNAAVPIVTMIGVSVALLISGSVVVETVFNLPGIGRLLMDAVLKRDYPVIQGIVLVFSFAYVAVNLVVDLVYVVLDPRIR